MNKENRADEEEKLGKYQEFDNVEELIAEKNHKGDIMQRPIKFRAKIKGDALVYQVWAIDWLNLRANIDRACGIEWVAFEKIEAFLQYTGLKDKNGSEIYEGDIVNLIPEGYAIVPAIVKWSDKELRWVSYRPETDTGSYLTSDSELEVIGNIYENPELLENK